MPPASSKLSQWRPWAECAGFAAAFAALACFELARHPEYYEKPNSLFGFVPDAESSWVLLLAASGLFSDGALNILLWPTWWGYMLFAAAPAWWIRCRSKVAAAQIAEVRSDGTNRHFLTIEWALCVGLVALSLVITVILVGRRFHGMPPAFHDEYSYLFQTKTFLAGRLAWTPHPSSDSFSQMHVLNDNGIFASRYFPGVGLWLAPWLALGQPYFAQYLATGLIVFTVFWIGYELPGLESGSTAGSPARGTRIAVAGIAGVICALSPALSLFGNLLLSHQPTTLGLSGFVYCYLRSLRSRSVVWPMIGGIALSLAMLCRPLTAFGFACPFAVHLASLVRRQKLEDARRRLVAALYPVAVAIIMLACYNTALTGNPAESPYGMYTRIYTPRHRYGFYNVRRSQGLAGPKTLRNYDNWAEELTPSRAIALSLERGSASAAWSLGRISLAWLGGVLLVIVWRLPIEWQLLVGSVIGLHAVYFPFGFEGIFSLSYVFESVPVLCLLAAGVIVWLIQSWHPLGRCGRIAWLVAMLLFNLNDPMLRLARGISEIRFSREYYAGFEERLRRAGVHAPAVVLIRPDPADRHRDLVTNSPPLNDPILRARLGTADDVAELMQYYPERTFWIYDAKSAAISKLRNSPK